MRTIGLSNYENIEEIFIDNFNQPINRIKNFSIQRDISSFVENRSIDTHVFIKEKAFVIDLVGYAHFHFIYDKLGQYEFLKKHFPDLGLYVVSTARYIDDENGILNTIKNIYNIPMSNILNIDFGCKYIFKDLFFIWPTHNDLFTGTFKDVWFDPWAFPEDFELYIKTIYDLLQHRFRDFILKTTSPPQKIYISQMQRHKLKGREKNKERYISEEDEIIIENFFKEMGYQIVTTENLNFLEQISLYSRSSHIAAIKSSAIVNTIFCNNNTNITIINVDKNYEIWYDYISMYNDLKCLEVPSFLRENAKIKTMSYFSKQSKPHTPFSIVQILESLKANLDYL